VCTIGSAFIIPICIRGGPAIFTLVIYVVFFVILWPFYFAVVQDIFNFQWMGGFNANVTNITHVALRSMGTDKDIIIRQSPFMCETFTKYLVFFLGGISSVWNG